MIMLLAYFRINLSVELENAKTACKENLLVLRTLHHSCDQCFMQLKEGIGMVSKNIIRIALVSVLAVTILVVGYFLYNSQQQQSDIGAAHGNVQRALAQEESCSCEKILIFGKLRCPFWCR